MNELDKLELEYIELFKDVLTLFPKYWFDIEDNKKKIATLKKAIKEKKLIVEISDDFVEGVF